MLLNSPLLNWFQYIGTKYLIMHDGEVWKFILVRSRAGRRIAFGKGQLLSTATGGIAGVAFSGDIDIFECLRRCGMITPGSTTLVWPVKRLIGDILPL